MLGNSGKIVDNYKVDPGKLDSLVLRKGLLGVLFTNKRLFIT